MGLGSKNDLKRHIDSVHDKKKPFMCSKCLATFSRKSYGKSHLKTIHQEEDINLIIDTSFIEKESSDSQSRTFVIDSKFECFYLDFMYTIVPLTLELLSWAFNLKSNFSGHR